MISYKCKDVQAALKVIRVMCTDDFYRICMYGLEGVDYVYDANGKRKRTDSVIGKAFSTSGAQFYVYYYIKETRDLRIDRLGFGFLPGQEEALVQLPLWLSFFLTLFTLTLIASVIELLDGIDGLAALATGAASLAVFTHAFVSGGDGDLFVQLFAWLLMVIALLAAWLGRPGGRLLLGKNGAFLLGHWLAILLVLARQKEATAKILTPFLILGLIAAVILLRFIERSLGFHLRKAGTKGQGKKEMANGE
jgi:UDP-N-acetylmuramyl pentapeptide phosphotransferase/UDP-N-acetylglucosamine-1-phosphate transferase